MSIQDQLFQCTSLIMYLCFCYTHTALDWSSAWLSISHLLSSRAAIFNITVPLERLYLCRSPCQFIRTAMCKMCVWDNIPIRNFQRKKFQGQITVWNIVDHISLLEIHDVHLHIKGFKKYHRKEKCLKLLHQEFVNLLWLSKSFIE